MGQAKMIINKEIGNRQSTQACADTGCFKQKWKFRIWVSESIQDPEPETELQFVDFLNMVQAKMKNI